MADIERKALQLSTRVREKVLPLFCGFPVPGLDKKEFFSAIHALESMENILGLDTPFSIDYT